MDVHRIDDNDTFYGKVEPGEIVYVLVVCEVPTRVMENAGDLKTSAARTFLRQMQQVEVILKTAAIFTKRSLHFILVTNTVNAFLKLRGITLSWPKHLTQNLRITRRTLWRPPNQEKLLQAFRPCSAACLFIHEALPDIDAVIYIDSDTFFLRSPEDLWPTFEKFNSKQIAGMSPCHYYYGPGFSQPFGYYGKSGINAGVIMMNLTRMRQSLPFDLTKSYIDIYEKYGKSMYLADQDILNHFYSLYPDLLHPFDCSWNMRVKLCGQYPFPCSKEGISLVHGCAMTFYNNDEPYFRHLFHALLAFDLNQTDVKKIPAVIEEASYSAAKERVTSCTKYPEINRYFLNYPVKIITEKYHHKDYFLTKALEYE